MQKASIVIINYNDKDRVQRAIESALSQSWENTEVIMVDDGSEPEVRELYKKYGNGITLIQLERTDKTARTPSRARNAGIEVATGDYICFLDSDNYYNSEFIESLIKHEKDYAFCNWEIVGLEPYQVNIQQVWQYQDILQNYLAFQHLDHQAVLFKRSYLDKIRDKYGYYYDERLSRSQDCCFLARTFLEGGEWFHDAYRGFVFEKHEKKQSKALASIYGKTLWTLKLDINLGWLLGLLNTPDKILSYHHAIDDFTNDPKWAKDYSKSQFSQLYENQLMLLDEELKEPKFRK